MDATTFLEEVYRLHGGLVERQADRLVALARQLPVFRNPPRSGPARPTPAPRAWKSCTPATRSWRRGFSGHCREGASV